MPLAADGTLAESYERDGATNATAAWEVLLENWSDVLRTSQREVSESEIALDARDGIVNVKPGHCPSCREWLCGPIVCPPCGHALHERCGAELLSTGRARCLLCGDSVTELRRVHGFYEDGTAPTDCEKIYTDFFRELLKERALHRAECDELQSKISELRQKCDVESAAVERERQVLLTEQDGVYRCWSSERSAIESRIEHAQKQRRQLIRDEECDAQVLFALERATRAAEDQLSVAKTANERLLEEVEGKSAELSLLERRETNYGALLKHLEASNSALEDRVRRTCGI